MRNLPIPGSLLLLEYLLQVLVQPQSSGNVRNFWGWLSSSAGTPGTCGGSLGAPLKRSWWSSEREGWG